MASYTKRVTKTKGTVWDVRAWDFRNGSKKQVRLSGFATRKEAQKAIYDYFNAPKIPAVKKDVSFAEAYEAYKVAKTAVLAQSTLYSKNKIFESHILPMFEEREINLAKSDIMEWRDVMWNKTCDSTGTLYGQKTLMAYWTDFHSFMVWASEMYGFPNPFDGVKIPHRREVKKEMNVWTAEEFGIFINAVNNPKHRLFFELLFYSGARKGEISALTVDDVEKRGDVYAIKISKNASRRHDGKGITVTPPKTYTSNRTVTLPECLTKELDEYLEGKEGYLFGGEAPADPGTYRRVLERIISETGLRHIRLHDLRHSHASILIAAGVPVTAVSKRLGHSTPRITLDVYSHCMEKGEEEVISVLNGLPVKKK